ncbi:polyprenyl synthetase family protein [Vallitalea pronyensis]|uniref:Farnesyl diphosphate synthase n=1 Tax=Vallitalea pronyensis TaxID=1348613 RepID=A0A8J8SHQ0_9FIRM|nr:farnesyl diphosphate synthase [Vallitalea pronyensis]QUI23801.1 polyprenyl synthetase family protein [Vallitalea pronyensis]
MDFNQKRLEKQQYVDDILKQYMASSDYKYDQIIYEAMSYSLMAGGKRVRPILMLTAYEISGGQNTTEVEAFMAAMEMIHTYSLIHDDLPAMDDDDYRRGRLTCHKKFGEDIAILAGDALLNHAYEIMTEACIHREPSLIVKALLAMKEIATAAGTQGMIGGQVVDMVDKSNINLNMIEFIHLHKTSAIIEASLTAGAYLAGASEEEVEHFRSIGRCIGLAFQIQDDILDITSTTEVLGKQVGSDHKNGKATYVALKGLEASKSEVAHLMKKALEELQQLQGDRKEFLKAFILYLRNRKK